MGVMLKKKNTPYAYIQSSGSSLSFQRTGAWQGISGNELLSSTLHPKRLKKSWSEWVSGIRFKISTGAMETMAPSLTMPLMFAIDASVCDKHYWHCDRGASIPLPFCKEGNKGFKKDAKKSSPFSATHCACAMQGWRKWGH